jgi:hypothetical protein
MAGSISPAEVPSVSLVPCATGHIWRQVSSLTDTAVVIPVQTSCTPVLVPGEQPVNCVSGLNRAAYDLFATISN